MKKRIGIVGGGQLGRMLTGPALELGFEVTVVDPTPNCPAAQVGTKQIIASLIDETAITKLANRSDVVTFEIEHINTEVLKKLQENGVTIHPSAQTLELIKDKLSQNQLLQKHSIPVAQFEEIKNQEEAKQFGIKYGFPFVLKSRYGGYDGRGNFLVKSEKEIFSAFEKLGNKNLYAEKFVPFIKELAVIAARDVHGSIVTYPVVETIHKNNICHLVLAPAPISSQVAKKAEELAKKVMQHLQGSGVFAIEMFLTENDQVLVNEIAPRVHNSGHFTIEACFTSQFEQHIRAITGMPLGKTDMKAPAAVMINILGERTGNAEVKGLEEVEKIPKTYVHIYGKLETKPERKMGHITVLGQSVEEAKRNAIKARKLLSI